MTERDENHNNTTLYGIGVSAGVVSGPVHLLHTEVEKIPKRKISEKDVPSEIDRLETALTKTREQLHNIQEELSQVLDTKSASIFDAHMLVVDDRSFIEEIIEGVKREHKNVEWVLQKVCDNYAKALSKIEDDYLRERTSDVKDVTRRILRNLSGNLLNSIANLTEPCIVVAHDIPPSETALMNKDIVTGFATDIGSPSSHTAIMARALEIPAVVGLTDASTRIADGDHILLDGQQGILIIHPTEEELERYGSLAEKQSQIRTKLEKFKERRAETKDGRRIVLSANIEMPKDVANAKKYGSNGVGLFRTEFLYLSGHGLPDEDEQSAVYTKTAKELHPAPLIIRTIDIGGDKFISKYNTAPEINPFLGWRGIRFCLAQEDIFLKQLRSILRASIYDNVKIMYPMVSNAQEVVQANEMLETAKSQLRENSVEFNDNIEVGAMIEVPSAAITADLIAPYVDFFSIGTNDLVQYTMAVDRVNEKVSHLYEPTHPAILKLIKSTTDAKKRKPGLWIGICGEMAGNPLWTPLLLGLGIDEISANPTSIPEIKDVICNLNMEEATEIADKALQCSSASEVDELCYELVQKITPEIAKLIV
ncbi:MAG: phosphoenolpyruvate--protein phosphotransferase [Desulfatiglandaceae bacterium]